MILDGIFRTLIRRIPEMVPSVRVTLAQSLVDVAPFRPSEVLAVCKLMHESPAASQTVAGLFGDKEIGQLEVVQELPWLLFHAAMGAIDSDTKSGILRELFLLAIEEMRPDSPSRGTLSNNGKRATDALRRVIASGPSFRASYQREAASLALRELSMVETGRATTPGYEAALTYFLQPLVSVKKQQTWAEGFTIHLRTYVCLPGSEAWATRASIISRVRESLWKETAPVAHRVMLWRLLAEAHRDLNFTPREIQIENSEALLSGLNEDLEWALRLLTTRQLSIEELREAQNIWDWHLRFDNDRRRAGVAQELEEVYRANSLIQEFSSLIDEFSDVRIDVAKEMARELSSKNDPEVIFSFIERATLFFGDSGLSRLHVVAHRFGELALVAPQVQEFVRQGLGRFETGPKFDFVAATAASWISVIRDRNMLGEAFKNVVDLLRPLASVDKRVALLTWVYGGSISSSRILDAEHIFLRQRMGEFGQVDRTAVFVAIVGRYFDFDWACYKGCIDECLQEHEGEHIWKLVQALIGTIFWRFYLKSDEDVGVPEGLSEWLLEWVLHVPDLGVIDQEEYHLQQILLKTGRPPLAWLLHAIEIRYEVFDRSNSEGCESLWLGPVALSLNGRLSKFVVPISSDNCQSDDLRQVVQRLICDDKCRLIHSHALPRYVRDVDPGGVLVPGVIASRLGQLTADAIDQAYNLASVAGAYELNGQAWRTIAEPTLQLGSQVSMRQRVGLYNELLPKMMSYSSGPGEVPAVFVEQARASRTFLEEERSEVFIPFWQWRVEVTSSALEREEQEAREDRGD